MKKNKPNLALRKELLERNVSIADLSGLLGVTRNAAYRKVVGITRFYPEDINRVRIAWKLSDGEVVKLFIKP